MLVLQLSPRWSSSNFLKTINKEIGYWGSTLWKLLLFMFDLSSRWSCSNFLQSIDKEIGDRSSTLWKLLVLML